MTSADDHFLAVQAAHRQFYDAFEARDLDAMSDRWLHADTVSCTHPGWTTRYGWAAVSASWFALFQQPGLQFILTQEQIRVVADAAWVFVDENVIGDGEPVTVAAVNELRLVEGRWLVVGHHGEVVRGS